VPRRVLDGDVPARLAHDRGDLELEIELARERRPRDDVAGPDDRAKIFAGIKKALKPGGLLLLEGYRPKQLEYKTGGPGKLENLYTRELLEAAFADFTSIDIREYDAEIHEGPGHAGLSALIDLIGRK